jgi:RNA-binding protein YlmH
LRWVNLDRERFLKGVAGEDRILLARAADMAQAVLDSHQPHITDFYDPYHAGLVVSSLKSVSGLAWRADGGYPGAERQRLVICPDYADPEETGSGLDFLSITGNFSDSRPGHRDILGSMLGLGLKREKLGDILVNDNGAQAVVAAEVSSFIRSNLVKAGRWEVTVERIGRSDLKIPGERVKTIDTTVSSLRMDSVAAAGFGMSRSKMVSFITAERVSLNWQVRNSPSQPVNVGDIITIRGRGRVEVSEVRGMSKGGRIKLLLKRYY